MIDPSISEFIEAGLHLNVALQFHEHPTQPGVLCVLDDRRHLPPAGDVVLAQTVERLAAPTLRVLLTIGRQRGLDGLGEAEVFVVVGQTSLKNGSKVSIINAADAGEPRADTDTTST